MYLDVTRVYSYYQFPYMLWHQPWCSAQPFQEVFVHSAGRQGRRDALVVTLLV